MDKASAKGRPAGVQTLNGRKLPGAAAPGGLPGRPAGVMGKVSARQRPDALPVPADRKLHAFTKPSVLERWVEEGASVRPAAIASGDNVITMFDVIGEDYWSGGGITAKSVTAQLRAIGDRPIEVQINSPGGDMFEGLAIYNVLREHPQDITIKVMGMAASAASIIAMAGNQVEIGAASFIMIHNCWVMAIGNRHTMAETSDWLAPFDQAMADVYAQRTGQKPEAVAKWMDAETYMSGSMAIERGFADALLAADQVKSDGDTKAAAAKINELRAMEMTLMASGSTRSEARARVNKIRGTTDSAPEASTTDSAGDTGLTDELVRLISTIRS